MLFFCPDSYRRCVGTFEANHSIDELLSKIAYMYIFKLGQAHQVCVHGVMC